MTRAIVAQFQRFAGRIWLWSITVFEEKTTPRGSYISKTIYDVDYSKKFGYLFHQSGFGGDCSVRVEGLYFVFGDVKINEAPSNFVTRKSRRLNPTRRLTKLPPYFDLEPGTDILDWLQHNGIEQDAVYCSICRDYLPGDSYNLCSHIWWCEKSGWYSTPSEPCGHAREECES